MARIAAGPSGEERRLQIVDAALRAFAAKGFAGATTKDIAQEAGVTPGLIYHYFADKHALFDAILAEHSPIGGLATLFETEGADEIEPRVMLPLLVQTLVGRMEGGENAPVFRCIMSEVVRDPEVKERFNTNTTRVAESLAGYLRRQMERGRLRPLDPTLVAHLLIGSLVACVIRRAITGDPVLNAYSTEQIAATLVEMALGGLEGLEQDTRHGATP